MQHDDLVYLQHMRDFCQKALAFVEGVDKSKYQQDEKLQLALFQLIQRIGEAARHVSQEFCNSHPDVPWSDIVGMRHKLVHDYLEIDEDLVWLTVAEKLPELNTLLEQITGD